MRLPVVCLLLLFKLGAQEQILTLKTKTGDLEGSVILPTQQNNVPVVLIIPGSGPTDRNGNSSEMENNSLKMLAEELQKKNIASLRIDKRGVGQSTGFHLDETELRPETYIQDIRDWVDLLATDKRFTRVIIAGHSEGSLHGMAAAVDNPKVSGFISIAGAGRPIDVILKEQFSEVPPDIKVTIYGMLDKLKKGDTLSNVPPIFYAIFRPTLQPYMISWMQFDPEKEIKKLKIPVLITSGTTDVQVKEIDALCLAKGQPEAQFRMIRNMNHVLKTCDTLDKKYQVSHYYDNPTLPLNEEFVILITDFITQHFIAGTPVTPPIKKN